MRNGRQGLRGGVNDLVECVECLKIGRFRADSTGDARRSSICVRLGSTRNGHSRLPKTDTIQALIFVHSCWGIGHCDDDLALGTSCFKLGHCMGNLLEGVHAVDDYLEHTDVNETAEFG